MSYKATSGVSDLPRAPVKRIIKEANAGKPVSAAAVEELVGVLVAFGETIGDIANTSAQHAGRKTVMGKDIAFALSQL